MDTSPEYIRMCEKAVEIQSLWKPLGGDIFMGWADVDIVMDGEEPKELVIGSEIWGDYVRPMKGHSVWLPRQDQLQDLLWPEGHDLTLGECQLVWEFARKNREKLADFNSWEKLWLCFLMSENFNKTWNGEDWVIRG